MSNRREPYSTGQMVLILLAVIMVFLMVQRFHNWISVAPNPEEWTEQQGTTP